MFQSIELDQFWLSLNNSVTSDWTFFDEQWKIYLVLLSFQKARVIFISNS